MKQEGRLTKLVINNVEESDAGKYTCKTKDSQSSAELTVQGETGSSYKLSLRVLISVDFEKHLFFLLNIFPMYSTESPARRRQRGQLQYSTTKTI